MKRIGILLLLLINASPAFSIGEPISEANMLLGCYKRVLYPEDVMKKMNKFDYYNPETQKYQWYCFFENNVFRVITSNKDGEYTTEKIKDFFKAIPPTMSWKWVQDSIVWVDHKDDKNMNSNWLVRHIDKDIHMFGENLLPKGSLFMAIPTQDLESFVLVRVLEKLKN